MSVPFQLHADDASLAQTPTDVESLEKLEKRVIATIDKVLPTVVAVQSGDGTGFASGVIVAPDGLILSQFHVSHQVDPRTRERRKAGERRRVILHDGQICEAELLGADVEDDLSLLRLVDPGPYPCAILDQSVTAQRGDWILKLGHPGGYVKGRSPVARLGRVLDNTVQLFISDCQVVGGDSGGPFFDLNGQLIGILNKFPSHLKYDRDRPVAIASNSLIISKMDSMSKGEILGQEFKPRLSPNLNPLPPDEWRQGATVLSAWQNRRATGEAASSLVEVLNDLQVTALGTIVGADGWVLTKASELPANPTCRLPDGTIVASQVVGIHPAFDLALLILPVQGLTPVKWSNDPPNIAGTFVAAPSLSKAPLLAGILSAPQRDADGEYPTTVERASYRGPAARPPGLLGSPVQGRGYWIEFAEGEAAEAGINSGDVILSIGGHPIRRHVDLVECVQGREAGQPVNVQLIREGKHVEVDLTLRSDRPATPPGVSFRRGRFPIVFEHDLPLMVNECGGPVVNLRGEALGITICRVGGQGCLAIPANRIQEILPDLKSGKPLAVMPDLRTDPPRRILERQPSVVKTERLVTLTLDELKERLRQRRTSYNNLFVEFERRTELLAEPRLLAAWNINQWRDYTVREEVGLAGEKRYYRISLPLINMHAFPLDRVEAHDDAPQEVVERVRKSRQQAAEWKERGTFRNLFELNHRDLIEQTAVFDGKECMRFFGRIALPPQSPESFSLPVIYLAALGLRPIDPQRDDQSYRIQQRHLLPDSFTLYSRCDILPTEEIVDGTRCIVVEAEWTNPMKDNGEEVFTDTIWFDPLLDFSPRRWEQRVNGRINTVATNSDFDEFAPGCWLPWESSLTYFAPAWVSGEFQDSPAYRFNIQLRKASVALADSVAERKFQGLITPLPDRLKDAP